MVEHAAPTQRAYNAGHSLHPGRLPESNGATATRSPPSEPAHSKATSIRVNAVSGVQHIITQEEWRAVVHARPLARGIPRHKRHSARRPFQDDGQLRTQIRHTAPHTVERRAVDLPVCRELNLCGMLSAMAVCAAAPSVPLCALCCHRRDRHSIGITTAWKGAAAREDVLIHAAASIKHDTDPDSGRRLL